MAIPFLRQLIGFSVARSVETELLTVPQFLALGVQPNGTICRVQVQVPTAGVTATPGVNIKVRYNSASTNAAKWEVDGDSPELRAESTAAAGSTTNTGYLTPTGALSLTLPLAGVVETYVYSSDMLVTGPASNTTYAWLSYQVGLVGASDQDAAKVSIAGNVTAAQSSAGSSVRSATRLKTVAAGDLITPKARSLTSGTSLAINAGGTSFPYGVSAKYVAVVGP